MFEEGDLENSDMSDKSIRHSVRPRVLSEKGASYEIEKNVEGFQGYSSSNSQAMRGNRQVNFERRLRKTEWSSDQPE